MRTCVAGIALALCLLASSATLQAQNFFRMSFRGTAAVTNSSGKIVTVGITEANWLRDFAREKGLKTTKGLAVAYHLNADSKGDAIEVINARTREVQGSVFGLFFSEAFGRTGVTNAAGTQTKTLQYLYTSQDSHSMGAALVTKTLGSGSYPKMRGQLQYELLPNNFRRSLQICNGSFVTGSPFGSK